MQELGSLGLKSGEKVLASTSSTSTSSGCVLQPCVDRQSGNTKQRASLSLGGLCLRGLCLRGPIQDLVWGCIFRSGACWGVVSRRVRLHGWASAQRAGLHTATAWGGYDRLVCLGLILLEYWLFAYDLLLLPVSICCESCDPADHG